MDTSEGWISSTFHPNQPRTNWIVGDDGVGLLGNITMIHSLRRIDRICRYFGIDRYLRNPACNATIPFESRNLFGKFVDIWAAKTQFRNQVRSLSQRMRLTWTRQAVAKWCKLIERYKLYIGTSSRCFQWLAWCTNDRETRYLLHCTYINMMEIQWKYNNRCSFGNSLGFLALHLPKHVISSGLVSPQKTAGFKNQIKKRASLSLSPKVSSFSTIVVQWNMAVYLKGTYYWTYINLSHTRPWLWEELANLPCSGFAKTTTLNKKARTWHGMPCCVPATNTKMLSKHTDFGGPAFNFAIISSYLYRCLVSTFCRN